MPIFDLQYAVPCGLTYGLGATYQPSVPSIPCSQEMALHLHIRSLMRATIAGQAAAGRGSSLLVPEVSLSPAFLLHSGQYHLRGPPFSSPCLL